METRSQHTEHESSGVACERVLADLRNLVQDAEDLLKATAADLSDHAKGARSRLTAALARAKSTCRDLEERGITTAKAAALKADAVVREHPYESMGAAFGLGLLIGVLVMRRSPP